MVGVRDGGSAPRGGADVVAQNEHPAQQPREEPAPRVHGDQITAVGRRVEPTQPHRPLVGPAQPPAGHRRRDAAVTGYPGRFHDRPVQVAGAGQCPVGHHEMDLDRLKHPRFATGEGRQGGVGSDGAHASALVALLLTVPADDGASPCLECRLRPGHLDHRPEDRQVRHAVGGPPYADPARAHCSLHPAHHRRGVDLGSDPAGGPVGLGQPELSEEGSDPAVDLGMVLVGEAGCRLRHRRRVPLRALPGCQHRHRGRKLGEESTAQPDEAVAQSGRLPPRQRHFRPHRPGHVARGGPLSGLTQGVHGPGLCRRRGALDPFQLGNEVHPLPITQCTHVHGAQPCAECGDTRRHAMRKRLSRSVVRPATRYHQSRLCPHERTIGPTSDSASAVDLRCGSPSFVSPSRPNHWSS